MPDITVRKGTLQISFNVELTGADCVILAPDPAQPVTANLYREDPVTGMLALDVALGAAGVLTLTEQMGMPGFYGVNFPISTVQYERYTVWVQWRSSGVQRRKLVRLFISEDLTTIYQGAITTPSSRDTLLAP